MGLGQKPLDRSATTRVAAPFTEAELQAIDAWGFARRMRNRTDVIRTLVTLGMKASTTEPA